MNALHQKAAVLALSEVKGAGPLHHLAQLLEEAGIEALLTGETADQVVDPDSARVYAAGLDGARIAHWEQQLGSLEETGIKLVTVLDDDYPVNLRLIFNRPPFLFVWGEVTGQDQHSVAVVGTRNASAEGRQLATELSTGLAEKGITVVSGLALGIDVAAHAAAVNAGGRTIAVLGSGINRVSPTAHRGLAHQIARSGRGAVVSQFLPDVPPQRWTFPVRNIVTSGLSTGTVVVEAGETSGARIQAEKCLEHGKRLFLVQDLVLHREWARQLAERPGASVVSSAAEIIDEVCRDRLLPADIAVER